MSVTEPGHYNIKMNQGATFSLDLTWREADETPVDLSGATGSLPIYEKVPTTVKPYFELTKVFEFTTADSSMVLGGALGTISLSADATTTDSFDWDDALYDLFIQFPGGDTVRLLDGHVVLAKRFQG